MKDNYYGIWKNFNRFYLRLDKKPDNWEDRLVLYVGHLIHSGRKSTTIRCYISAIRAILQDANVELMEDKVLLSSLTRACKIHNDVINTHLPIRKTTLSLLLKGVTKLFRESPQPYLETLYKTMFITAYYGLFRIGEITDSPHNIKAKDVQVGTNKNKLMFILRSSKTHNPGDKPQIVKIDQLDNINQKESSPCPFKYINSYLKMRKLRRKGDKQEPFFVFKDRSPVTAANFRLILKQSLKAAGLDCTFYSASGFRSGRACDLLDLGISVETIRKLGHWKSNSVYTYLRT